jgi:hypothetical protein
VHRGKRDRTTSGREIEMPVWFFVLLAIILLLAVVFAVAMGFGRRSVGGQNTTIVERRPLRTTDREDVTIVEGD